ncbi:MAG: ankyrin repeat domain-containing protein [Chlamydiota bacterium]|jgi:serine/threonine-protein phosphatase 6 regulatory ankyrin repeat subunit B
MAVPISPKRTSFSISSDPTVNQEDEKAEQVALPSIRATTKLEQVRSNLISKKVCKEIEKGHTEKAILAINNRLFNPNYVSNGLTPLQKAVIRKDKDVLRALLNYPDINIEQHSAQTESPLSLAIEEDDLNIVQLLVERGANINARDRHGKTLIEKAYSLKNIPFSPTHNYEVLLYLICLDGIDLTVFSPEDKNRLLLIALKYKSEKAAVTLIKNGANASISYCLGHNPLMQSVTKKWYIATEELLKLPNVNVNQTDSFDSTALDLAVDMGDLAMVRLLVENGANIHQKAPIQKAFLKGHYEVALYLLSLDNIHLSYMPEDVKLDLLHIALHRKNASASLKLLWNIADTPNVLEQIIDCYPNLHSIPEKEKKLLFYLAIQEGNLTIVQDLLRHHIVEANEKFDNGKRPLHIATASGHLEIVKLLKDTGANINEREANTSLPVEIAYLSNQPEILWYFLSLEELSLDLLATIVKTDMLFLAIDRKQNEAAIRLIQNGANIHICEGQTPLISAVIANSLPIVQELLKHPEIEIDQKDANENTALLWSAHQGHLEISRLLIAQGANAHAKNKSSFTPLITAIEKQRFSIIQELVNNPKIQINQPGFNGAIALHYAVNKGDHKTTELLLQHGANVNAVTNREQMSPLMTATKQGDLLVMQVLLAHPEIQVDLPNIYGYSPLFGATANGHLKATQLLIQHGANINQIGENRLPIGLAIQNKHFNVVNYLLAQKEIKVNFLQIAISIIECITSSPSNEDDKMPIYCILQCYFQENEENKKVIERKISADIRRYPEYARLQILHAYLSLKDHSDIKDLPEKEKLRAIQKRLVQNSVSKKVTEKLVEHNIPIEIAVRHQNFDIVLDLLTQEETQVDFMEVAAAAMQNIVLEESDDKMPILTFLQCYFRESEEHRKTFEERVANEISLRPENARLKILQELLSLKDNPSIKDLADMEKLKAIQDYKGIELLNKNPSLEIYDDIHQIIYEYLEGSF